MTFTQSHTIHPKKNRQNFKDRVDFAYFREGPEYSWQYLSFN